MVASEQAGKKVEELAPISATTRARLERDVKDLRATAARKRVTMDAHEHAVESQAAEEHFELGCWMYYMSRRIGTGSTATRIECVRRLFEAGIDSPGYMFFSVFDFGERQFDSCFESGDGELVVEGLVALATAEPDSKLAMCVKKMGWAIRDKSQQGLF